jgi:hypothetical protein
MHRAELTRKIISIANTEISDNIKTETEVYDLFLFRKRAAQKYLSANCPSKMKTMLDYIEIYNSDIRTYFKL